MRNPNRREQTRSSNQSWSQPWSNRNRGSQQRFMNEGNTNRNSGEQFEQDDQEYDREDSWQERQHGSHGYGSESDREYSGRQFGRDQGREYLSGPGRSHDWGENTGSGRGYGNDPESFASSYERSNLGDMGRGYYGDTYGTTSYGGGRGTYGTSEGYGSGRGQHSNWAFGRSWNRDEDETFGSMGNRGQAYGQSGSTWDTQESHRGKGPKGYQRSDERIREDINDRLTDDHRIDASEIEVRVEKGEVTLGGTVQDRNAKRIAEDIVESVSGVKNVENRIRLGGEESSKTQATGSTTKSNDRSKVRESVA